ncbi:MAG TPA: amidase [Propionibacterium sp.]|nr:amidase [Propionibacterium sp.]
MTRTRSGRLARDAEIGAFTHLAAATATMPGLTAGIKDVIETVDLPTALGSEHYRGRRTGRDAAVVAALRAAGVRIVGKTTTAEFAYRDAPATVNPLDVRRTPGGSSSGSAAAVAAGMVDFALGTQTGGSIIRPAAYCGVVGFKPTFGLVSTSGVMQLAPSFDTVGVLARDVAMVARVAELIAGLPPLIVPEAPPRVGVLPDRELTRCEPEMTEALIHARHLIEASGGELVTVGLPVELDCLRELHALINAYEGARSLAAEARHCREQTAGLIERGLRLAPPDFAAAVSELESLRPLLDDALGRVDVLLSPASLGLPPLGLTHTGGSDYCQPWSAARIPAVTIPLRRTPRELPLGMQFTAPRWQDAALLGWAAWLERAFGTA